MTYRSSRSGIATHGKFFICQRKRFFFKAIRFDEIPTAALDFNRKLALRKRLEEVKAGHATGIVVLRGGVILGGDSFFYYTGSYSYSRGKWRGVAPAG